MSGGGSGIDKSANKSMISGSTGCCLSASPASSEAARMAVLCVIAQRCL
jgi:hypothetical protein